MVCCRCFFFVGEGPPFGRRLLNDRASCMSVSKSSSDVGSGSCVAWLLDAFACACRLDLGGCLSVFEVVCGCVFGCVWLCL
jgi:hypothetical protein